MSTWDDMKRVHEEEYFLREEAKKRKAYSRQLRNDTQARGKARSKLASADQTASPLTGATMTKTVVAGQEIMDCPREGTLLITYEALATALSGDNATREAWLALVAPDSEDTPAS